jgi:hypothetical protein
MHLTVTGQACKTLLGNRNSGDGIGVSPSRRTILNFCGWDDDKYFDHVNPSDIHIVNPIYKKLCMWLGVHASNISKSNHQEG